MRYSTKPRKRKYVKGNRFLSFAKNLSNKYGKKLIDTANKTGLGTAKSASKKIIQKTAEAIREPIGNTIAGKIMKPKPISDSKPSDLEEIVL